ncbi:1901_t:CDS:2 [Ambispora gerdemannii]|uniref:1901_t:CDS:1 n=1 Tax=Ambispora gerdemannii TaxID=144530 RepID=A0A9N8VC98_9GLOM|nr:1901_t:CDS:2 [Ambispora gerdemannii]
MSFTPDQSAESERRLFQEPKFTVNIESDPGSVSDFLGNVNLGSARLREMAGLGGGLEFLPLEEHQVTRGAIPSLSFGGTWGLMEGFRGHSPNFKLRLNTILNSVTRRGPFVGNSCGVLAMGYNTINGIMGNVRGKRDTLNEIGSGALIGAMFKSTAGIRAASAASLICASAAGTWALVKRYYFKY